tara:strand:+ start:315 stop:689 length:375 start_codon:yes stop_codon:yes gene_type:complete
MHLIFLLLQLLLGQVATPVFQEILVIMAEVEAEEIGMVQARLPVRLEELAAMLVRVAAQVAAAAIGSPVLAREARGQLVLLTFTNCPQFPLMQECQEDKVAEARAVTAAAAAVEVAELQAFLPS